MYRGGLSIVVKVGYTIDSSSTKRIFVGKKRPCATRLTQITTNIHSLHPSSKKPGMWVWYSPKWLFTEISRFYTNCCKTLLLLVYACTVLLQGSACTGTSTCSTDTSFYLLMVFLYYAPNETMLFLFTF